MNPESKNFSKFESVLVISEYTLSPKIVQKPKRTTQPKKPTNLIYQFQLMTKNTL